MTDDMTFRFLGESRRIGDDWLARDASHLWRYNLHYFDDLNAVDATSRRMWHDNAMRCWMRGNPVGKGDGWDPYPTSLRIVNWIKHAISAGSIDASLVDSLAVQTRHLRRHLEYHLLGNHLFANAKALCFAGCFFESDEAHAWLDAGLAILAREFPEQILADGGQFERSTMYHAIAFEDVLDLVNITRAFPGAIQERWADFISSWLGTAAHMGAWLAAMCHPDGEIAYFNDAAIGIAPSPEVLFCYARNLGVNAAEVQMRTGLAGHDDIVSHRHLNASGYIRADAPNAVLFLDVAPLGPSYLMGHAHADTLSFELSIEGRRLIVNSGTSRYGNDAQRGQERGTPAHSTVTIDGSNSSEVWAGFRVAGRAHPIALDTAASASKLMVFCGHDGYRRLPGSPIHFRRWELEPRRLVVEDRIEGPFGSAEARFHLHPHVRCAIDAQGDSGTMSIAGGMTVRWSSAGSKSRIEEGFYCPEFGRRVDTQCLIIPMRRSTTNRLELVW
jgi:uncharacterized heparinase superfamily protein